MKIGIVILVAIMLFIIGCEKPSELPTKYDARKAMLGNLGCQLGWKFELGSGTPVVDGRSAEITLPVTCYEKGRGLRDFGESCKNLMGCCELYRITATCTANLKWRNSQWNASRVNCIDKQRTRKGSVACPEGR